MGLFEKALWQYRPNAHLHEFRNGQIRAVAAGTRGSYSRIARDYNGACCCYC